MSRTRTLTTFLFATLFLVAACGSGTATTAPSVAPASEPASAAPSSEAPPSAAASASVAAGGGAPCAVAQSAGTVTDKIANFAFSPASITAKVGDTITWTNNDTTGHTATVDGQDACTTTTLASGASGSITFSQAGTYPFHCKIHPNMTGTITVS